MYTLFSEILFVILEPHLAVVEAVCPVVEAGGHNHPVLGRRGHGLAPGGYTPGDLAPGA